MWVSKVHSCSFAIVPQLALIIMILGTITIDNVVSSSKYKLSSRKGKDNWSHYQRISSYPKQDSFNTYSSDPSTFYADDQLLKRDSASSNFESNTNLAPHLSPPNMEQLSTHLLVNSDSSISGQDHTKHNIMFDAQNFPAHSHDSSYMEQQPHSGYHYYPQPMDQHHHHYEEEQKELIEVEDKVFSKTIVATKALKVGKFIFTFFMVLVVFVLAGLAKLGVSLSPAILPLALFPIGVIASLLFIPLFIIFVPIVASGLAGGKKRRRRRSASVAFKDFENELDKSWIILQQVLMDELNHIIVKIRA